MKWTVPVAVTVEHIEHPGHGCPVATAITDQMAAEGADVWAQTALKPSPRFWLCRGPIREHVGGDHQVGPFPLPPRLALACERPMPVEEEIEIPNWAVMAWSDFGAWCDEARDRHEREMAETRASRPCDCPLLAPRRTCPFHPRKAPPATAPDPEQAAKLAALLAQATKTPQRHSHDGHAEAAFISAIDAELRGREGGGICGVASPDAEGDPA